MIKEEQIEASDNSCAASEILCPEVNLILETESSPLWPRTKSKTVFIRIRAFDPLRSKLKVANLRISWPLCGPRGEDLTNSNSSTSSFDRFWLSTATSTAENINTPLLMLRESRTIGVLTPCCVDDDVDLCCVENDWLFFRLIPGA